MLLLLRQYMLSVLLTHFEYRLTIGPKTVLYPRRNSKSTRRRRESWVGVWMKNWWKSNTEGLPEKKLESLASKSRSLFSLKATIEKKLSKKRNLHKHFECTWVFEELRLRTMMATTYTFAIAAIPISYLCFPSFSCPQVLLPWPDWRSRKAAENQASVKIFAFSVTS